MKLKQSATVATGMSLVVAVAIFFLFLLGCPRFDDPLSFALYDREGKLLGASVASDGQWRIPAKEIPYRFRTALLVFEDKRFFIHPGIDPLSLARALWQNTASGRIISGGSTITMQTVRLSRKNPGRTIPQKAAEALLSLVLETLRSKDDIIALYAANAPFGGNVVGLEAASWRYYNRTSTDLTWAEAATLAVLPNQPSLVNPARERERLLSKRNRLLSALREAGLITESELKLSLEEELPDKPYPLPRLASHYLERRKLTGESKTGIDRNLQISVVSILERWSASFAASGINNAAAIVIDTRSGEILAYAGNTGSGREKKFNTDVDIVTAKRSSGSLLKPFLFAAMLDAGLLLPNQLVADIPTRIGSYKPENNVPVYLGVVPAGEALSRSLNIPAIRELREFGIAPFLEILRKTGFTTFTRSADEYGLPLILGGGEVTLEETVRAYAALMNRSDPDSIKPEKEANTFPESPASTGAAWLTLEALINGARPNDEALWQSFASAQKIAWKTGTSWGNRDAWAVGVTPERTVGIWVGNASGEGRPELKSITTAAPVLFEIFSILPPAPWPVRPELQLEEITVCADSGYIAGNDCNRRITAWKPRDANYANPCPFCQTVSLTPDGKFRATANDLTGKWRDSLPLVRKQFVLPPILEYWYTRQSLTYRELPPWIPEHTGDSAGTEMAIVFPENGAHIFLPVELDGTPGSLILEATHRNKRETLYWDIDGEYLGETKNYHQLSTRPVPGRHVLTVTDTRGSRASRSFEILGE